MATRNPAELDRPANTIIDRQGVFICYAVMGISSALLTWVDPDSLSVHRIGNIIVALILLGLGFLKFFDISRINAHPLRYIITYTTIIFLGLLFLADFATPWVVVWIPALLVSNLFFGPRAVWWSVNVFGIMTILKFFYAYLDGATVGEQHNVLAAWFVMVAVAFFYVSIQKIFEKEHQELKATLVEARQQEQRLLALINNMTESVLVLDSTYCITLYNAAALGLLDTNQNVTGKTLDQVVHLVDAKNQPVTVTSLVKDLGQAVTRQDLYLVYGENDRAALSTTITPIRAAFGEAMQDGYIVTMRDITREKTLEDERDEFISVISHELRTPVTVTEANLSNAILVQERGQEPEKIKNSLKNAHDQVLYLATLLNDLTTFARAEQGNLKLTGEPIKFTDLMDELMSTYQKQATDKGLNLSLQLDPSVPTRFVSSPLYIKEVLQNFIVNAIKYSDTGTITVKVSGAPNGDVRFDVTDQGIGISTSDQQKVFHKFFRSEDYRTRSTNGTGLGLYIVRKLADVLHGRVELVSEIGKGSTFSLIVPNQQTVTTAGPAPTRISTTSESE